MAAISPACPRSTLAGGALAGPLARQMLRRVDRYLGRGFPTGALRYLRAQKAEQRLRRHDFADAMARVARGYFVFSKDREALEAAQISLAASDGQFVLANWTAGLAAWRLGDYQAASSYFGNLGRATTVPPGRPRGGRLLGVAGAFDFATTGRVDQLAGHRRPQSRYVLRSFGAPQFRRRNSHRLGFAGPAADGGGARRQPPQWPPRPRLDPGRPRPARRAAFAQNGGRRRGELWPTLMTIAARHNMPGLSLRLAAMLYGRDGRMSHAGMYRSRTGGRKMVSMSTKPCCWLPSRGRNRASMCAPKAVVAPAG